MFRKTDAFIIAAVLAVALIVFGATALLRTGQQLSGTVNISSGGEITQTARLDANETIRVEQPDGRLNIIEISGGEVRMAYSSCKNQLCLQQGGITADNWTRRSMGRSIVCLPNQVLVELALDEGHPSLQTEDLPDI